MHIERKAVKHLRLVIERDASVRLVVPKRVSLREAARFFEAKQGWVTQKRQQLLALQAEADALDEIDRIQFRGETYAVVFDAKQDAISHANKMLMVAGPQSAPARLRVWRNMAAQDLRERLAQEAERLAVVVNKVSVRDQKSCWGSCSSKGNISLNWRVALMPLAVGNYIIAHEFAHLMHMNHSPAFWAEVERLCPKYQKAERWIKTNGSALMLVQRV